MSKRSAKTRVLVSAVACYCLVGGNALWAQSADRPNPIATALDLSETEPDIVLTDASFVERATRANLAELAAARLALDKATVPATRDFAQRMLDAHRRAQAQLTAHAQRLGLAVPQQLGSAWEKELARLGDFSGDLFDRAYAERMVSAHEHTLEVFEDAAITGGIDSSLQQWAAEQVALLGDHLEQARSLQRHVE